MKKPNLSDFAAIIIWLIPIFYLVYIFPSLPKLVPLKFDAEGNPIRFGTQTEFLWTQVLIQGIAVFVYLLVKFVPSIDPKKNAKYSSTSFKKIALAVIFFVSAINIVVIYAVSNHTVKINFILFPLIGILFAFLGNLMHSIKPNYFVGIRTPWTLEDPDTWRATHQLSGKLWFVGGLLITIATLFLPAKIGFSLFVGITILIGFIPVIYSFIYFKNHKK